LIFETADELRLAKDRGLRPCVPHRVLQNRNLIVEAIEKGIEGPLSEHMVIALADHRRSNCCSARTSIS